MTLLVVTPTLGRSRFLRETVRSVADVGAEIRHVLVSPPDAVAGLRQEYPNLDVVTDDTPGVYAAINRGLATDTDWDAWTWINDDDMWRSDGLRRSLACLRNGSDVDVVYGRVDYIDADSKSLGPLPVERDPSSLRDLFASRIPALTQHGTLVRRDLATKLGSLDTRLRLAADFDYWARALAVGARCACVPEVVAYFRLRPGQISGDTSEVRREIELSASGVFGSVAASVRERTGRRFRRRHFLDLVRRFTRTGCWRSEQLFRRAAQGKKETAR